MGFSCSRCKPAMMNELTARVFHIRMVIVVLYHRTVTQCFTVRYRNESAYTIRLRLLDLKRGSRSLAVLLLPNSRAKSKKRTSPRVGALLDLVVPHDLVVIHPSKKVFRAPNLLFRSISATCHGKPNFVLFRDSSRSRSHCKFC